MSRSLKICSWNVNGIRAVAKKGFHDWLQASQFDIVCLQETKAQADQLDKSLREIEGYPFIEFNSAERKGYSGVANLIQADSMPLEYSKGLTLERFASCPQEITEIIPGKSQTDIKYANKVISSDKLKEQVTNFNNEGRVLESRHRLNGIDYILFNIYFPNGGASTERLKFKLEFYEALLLYLETTLKENPNIIITGDYNTAHHAIDLARPNENTNTSGFMPIERVYLDRLEALGFQDTFRYLHPEQNDAYTWWSFRTAARERNVGWRIDYFYISKNLLPHLKSAEIHSDITGSDHCPISIILEV